mgnify:CR=1 FL=1
MAIKKDILLTSEEQKVFDLLPLGAETGIDEIIQGSGLPRECAEVAARTGLAPVTLLTTADRALVVAGG